MEKLKRASDRIQDEVLDLAINEMKAVLEGSKGMSDVGSSAFRLVGDYAKVMGAENQKEALDFTIEKYEERKALNVGDEE